jgi:putative FmdB family regulatory protein
MPLYEYKCECGKTFDAIQGMNEEKLELCQNGCDEPKKVQRLIGKPMILSDDIGRGVRRMTDKKLYKELDIE